MGEKSIAPLIYADSKIETKTQEMAGNFVDRIGLHHKP